MKQYVEVYWTPWTQGLGNHPFISSHVLTQQPDPIISAIIKERPDAGYTKCPAFVDACRNGFVIKSPVDINITLDHSKKTLTTDRYGQDFYECEINNRGDQSSPSNPFLMSLFPKILFYAKEPVEVEQLDLMVLTAPANVKTIPGKFDISKWIRPVEWAIEVDHSVTTLSIKTGDPLFMVRFKTLGNIPVKLVRVNQTIELGATVNAFLSVKKQRPKLKLKQLYELSKNYLEAFWRNK
jgi:hypothetical protein